jgi:hypothetical protein
VHHARVLAAATGDADMARALQEQLMAEAAAAMRGWGGGGHGGRVAGERWWEERGSSCRE